MTTLLWRGDGVTSTQVVAEVGAMHVYKDERGKLSKGEHEDLYFPFFLRIDSSSFSLPVFFSFCSRTFAHHDHIDLNLHRISRHPKADKWI